MLFLTAQTQVCVQQTALDLINWGYDVHVLADAVSSRSQVDRIFALEVRTLRPSHNTLSSPFPIYTHLPTHLTPQRMRQSGVFITTSESLLFELLGDSKHPKFKEVQALIKTSAPDSGLLTKL